MSRLIVSVTVCLYLLLVSAGLYPVEATPLIEAGRVVDGFAGVPWGAGVAQIDKVMTTKKFSDKAVLNQGNAVRYRGQFAGYPAYMVFSLWNDQFYEVTVSGICQIWDESRSGEIRECFSHLKALLIERYGQPRREAGWQEARIYYWTELFGPAGQKEKLDLMLSIHFPQGGLTEGSIDIRFSNQRLETCLYAQMMGRICPETVR